MTTRRVFCFPDENPPTGNNVKRLKRDYFLLCVTIASTVLAIVATGMVVSLMYLAISSTSFSETATPTTSTITSSLQTTTPATSLTRSSRPRFPDTETTPDTSQITRSPETATSPATSLTATFQETATTPDTSQMTSSPESSQTTATSLTKSPQETAMLITPLTRRSRARFSEMAIAQSTSKTTKSSPQTLTQSLSLTRSSRTSSLVTATTLAITLASSPETTSVAISQTNSWAKISKTTTTPATATTRSFRQTATLAKSVSRRSRASSRVTSTTLGILQATTTNATTIIYFKIGTENLAFAKNATQSSNWQYAGETAYRAVDGNDDPYWFSKSCSHTDLEAYPWWEVDLGDVYKVRRILLTNRQDCCAERLSNIKTEVGTEHDSMEVCATHEAPVGVGATITLYCPLNMVGRIMRVTLQKTDFLALCEVQIYSE